MKDWGMDVPVGNNSAAVLMIENMRRVWAALEGAGGGVPKAVVIPRPLSQWPEFMAELKACSVNEGFEIVIQEPIA